MRVRAGLTSGAGPFDMVVQAIGCAFGILTGPVARPLAQESFSSLFTRLVAFSVVIEKIEIIENHVNLYKSMMIC